MELSVREWQIVRLVVRAFQVKEIAAELGISPNTTSQYLQNIYRKLGIGSKTELAVWGVQQQIETPPPEENVA